MEDNINISCRTKRIMASLTNPNDKVFDNNILDDELDQQCSIILNSLETSISQHDNLENIAPGSVENDNNIMDVQFQTSVSRVENISPETDDVLVDLDNQSMDPDYVLENSEMDVNDDNEEEEMDEETINREVETPGEDTTNSIEKFNRDTNKKRRMQGQSYKGYQRSANGVVTYGVQRSCRKMGEPCNSKFCEKSKLHFCNKINNEERKAVFHKFWEDMSWDQKKIFVTAMVEYIPKKRSSTEGPSRRQGTYQYYLKINGCKKRVCKKMFLGTLALKEDMVHEWVKTSESGILKSTENRILDRRVSSNKRNETRRTFLKTWLDSLPTQASHYCRKDSSKKYLEQFFQSKADVFKEYHRICEEQNEQCLSKTVFEKLFKEMNYSVYKPRKDRCDLCCAYEAGNIEENKYREHLLKKDRAQEEKSRDKEEAQAKKNYTFTMDLQAVKICPSLNASALYYKLKLSVHNFTMYNLDTHQCKNFWWDESEGDLCASTFANFILNYLQEICTDKSIPIILYSDGCCYQNRNSTLSNALLKYAIENNIIIEQKYLEKGHTYMECDAVHSLIERRLKNRRIFLPSDYIKVTQEARTNPVPLEAEYITHNYFVDYGKGFTIYDSIRPGKRTGDPTVTDLRVLRYDPTEKKIFYKLDFRDEFQPLPARILKYPTMDNVYPPLHSERLKIAEKKWKHLQELKEVLPADCHAFYDNLPYC